MSATLHEELFQNYFNGCPVIRVKGRMFPVEDYYLEDILRLTGYEDEMLSKEGMSLPVKTQPYVRQNPQTGSIACRSVPSPGGSHQMCQLFSSAYWRVGDGVMGKININTSFKYPQCLSDPRFATNISLKSILQSKDILCFPSSAPRMQEKPWRRLCMRLLSKGLMKPLQR